jgi:hypothetical protein
MPDMKEPNSGRSSFLLIERTIRLPDGGEKRVLALPSRLFEACAAYQRESSTRTVAVERAKSESRQ